MNKFTLISFTFWLLLVVVIEANIAQAANVDDLDVTIDLMGPNEHSSANMMDRISLPTQAVEKAQAKAATGVDTANQAREKNRERLMNENRENIRDVITESGVKIPPNNSVEHNPPK